MAGEHSILPPSSAARRMACPGSRALEAAHPREESESAKEGTRAHEIAANYLIDKFQVLRAPVAALDFVPTDTDEMLEGAKQLAASIQFNIDPTLVPHIIIEKRIAIKSIHPECWGTPDVWVVGENNILHIWDYKFGHSYVDVFENWQLIAYASGILDLLATQNRLPPITDVHFHIVQPRCYKTDNVEGWLISVDELWPYLKRLGISEHVSMRPDAKCQPSPQCKHCDASHVCQALQLAALEATETATENTPNDLTPDALGNELRVLQHSQALLDARINGLEQHATTLLKKGKPVPHFSLEQTNGRQVWNIPVGKIAALAEIYGAKLLKEVEAVTPLQAIKAGVPEKAIQKYSQRMVGGLKLVADDGKKARKTFGGTK